MNNAALQSLLSKPETTFSKLFRRIFGRFLIRGKDVHSRNFLGKIKH